MVYIDQIILALLHLQINLRKNQNDTICRDIFLSKNLSPFIKIKNITIIKSMKGLLKSKIIISLKSITPKTQYKCIYETLIIVNRGSKTRSLLLINILMQLIGVKTDINPNDITYIFVQ